MGGAQRYVYDLAVGAKKEGHHVGVICGGNGALIDKLKKIEIYPQILPFLSRDISIKNDIGTFSEIFKILKKQKPDIFHINSSKMGLIGVIAGRLAGINKIIFTAHGWAFNEPKYIKFRSLVRLIYWLTIILSHKTICVSQKLKNDVSDLPWTKNKLVVIKNGIEEFQLLDREEARQKLAPGISSDTILVGSFSELHKVKGLDILIEAFGKFKKNKDAILVLIGSGEELENLKNLSIKLDIQESVIFLGYLDNARSYLNAVDIFMMPSRSEGLPYAILEAGMAEKPVIASGVGGIPEIIVNNQNGILVPKEDPESLKRALEKLYEDPKLRLKLGQSLKEAIKENYSEELMIDKTFELYRQNFHSQG